MIGNRRMCLEGTLSHGLELLHYVFKNKGHAHLALTMQERITYPKSNPLSRALRSTEQSMWCKHSPSDWFSKRQNCDPFPFQGDNGEFPPLAWTLIWKMIYKNMLRWYIFDDFRLWGYIMWDAARLECTGAKGIFD